jgi:hypothetical protein
VYIGIKKWVINSVIGYILRNRDTLLTRPYYILTNRDPLHDTPTHTITLIPSQIYIYTTLLFDISNYNKNIQDITRIFFTPPTYFFLFVLLFCFGTSVPFFFVFLFFFVLHFTLLPPLLSPLLSGGGIG